MQRAVPNGTGSSTPKGTGSSTSKGAGSSFPKDIGYSTYARDVSRARAILPRQDDLAVLFADVREMNCVSVVGVSNLGKSALLRTMTEPAIQQEYLSVEAPGYLFTYIDFNQMLEMSEQAFYELVLRCSIDTLRQAQADAEVLRRVEAAYTGLVAPASSFEIPLRFAQAMAAIGDLLPQRVVFLMDEIDEPVGGIDGRVFLNLRALKDKHRACLSYITATNRRLTQVATDSDVSEFGELFAHHILYISPLSPQEIADFAARFAAAEDVTFSDEDLAFIRAWSGGHPGLLEGTCRVLGLLTGRPARDRSQDWIIHRRAAEILVQDLNIQAECRKIWNDLTPGEQEALLHVELHHAGDQADEQEVVPEMDSVVAKHLVTESRPAKDAGSSASLGEAESPRQERAESRALGGGTVRAFDGTAPEPGRRIFARCFDEFVLRQRVARRPGQSGVRLDPDSGEVWVQGTQVPTLTNLEYRLLLLLYGRLGKICSKYDVVEAVWGEDYIDEVDDARIEKLISRLRGKLEPDPNNPHYLLTVRGRGYKLVQG